MSMGGRHVWQEWSVCGHGACMTGRGMVGGVWPGGMHDRQGACVACLAGGHVWHVGHAWPLQQMVHILLECILVSFATAFFDNFFLRFQTVYSHSVTVICIDTYWNHTSQSHRMGMESSHV